MTSFDAFLLTKNEIQRMNTVLFKISGIMATQTTDFDTNTV